LTSTVAPEPRKSVLFPERRLLSLPWRITIVLGLAVALWATWPQSTDPHLEAIGRAYLVEHHHDVAWGEVVRQAGLPGRVQVTFAGVRRGDQESYAIVSYARTGDEVAVSEARIYLGQANRQPAWRYFGVLALVALAVNSVLASTARTFARRCRRDRSVLRVREQVVHPQMFDRKGATLPPIIERWYECPICDFRHVEALVDPSYRGNSLVRRGVPFARSLRTIDYVDDRVESLLSRYASEGLTPEEYDGLLAEAKDAARAKCSQDSPWVSR